MTEIADLRREIVTRREEFRNRIKEVHPSLDEEHWYRALEAIRGGPGRHNDDKRFDETLASSGTIREANNAYLAALHKFYQARDGETGFLGR